MKIAKPWVSWEELEEITGGNWAPGTHTHVVADISDWGDWIDQAVKQASVVSFAGITDTGVTATNIAAGTTGQRPGGIVGDMRYNSTLGGFEVYTGAWKNMKLSGDAPTAHAASHESGGGDAIDALTFSNTGLRILDTGADHYLTIKPNEDLSASRVLSIITGDAARTITLSGNPTLADWFDQSVKQASDVNFNKLTLGAAHPQMKINAGTLASYSQNWGRNYAFLANAYYNGAAYVRDTAGYLSSMVIIEAQAAATGKCFYVLSGSDANPPVRTELFTILHNGKVGVGKVPTEKLDVDGNIKADTFLLAAGVTPNLGWLSDVTLGSLEEGETIRYDQATAKFIDAWGIDYDNPRLVYKIYTEFFKADNDLNDPWDGVSLGGGTMASVAGTSNHPGIIRLSSIATATTGYRFMTSVNSFLIAGAEHSEFCFKTGASLLNIRIRLGYQDSLTSVAPTDGVWIDITGATLTGKTSDNGAVSTTGTNHALAVNTWYRGKIAVNNDATEIVFILYSAAGVVLWTDTLAANIPTAAGRETGHGIVMSVAANVARYFDVDMMIATRAGYITR